MMQNKLTALLAIAGLLLVPGLQSQADPQGKQQTGILWKIEKLNSKPSYILGTVHSDDSRVINPPDIILQKLRVADSFSAELKMDSLTRQEASQLMFLPAGQTLESLIGKQRFRDCVRLLAQYGIAENIAQRMKPWAVMVTLSMPKSRTGIVLDHRLFMEAELAGKKTYGLETNREQVAVFESFSLRDQIIMLDDAINDFDRLPSMFDELVHYYLQGDLTGLARISDKYMMQGNSPIAISFKKIALRDRNYRMVRRMKPRLLEGNSFIAVGALHLPGDEGILQLLEKEGYRVTPVY